MSKKLVSFYIREQEYFSFEQLLNLFDLPDKEMREAIRLLRSDNILKVVRKDKIPEDLSELGDENLAITEIKESDDNYLYTFSFVGLLDICGRIVKCYPKYILSKNEPEEEMKQVLNVIRKENNREQFINLFNGDSSDKFNILAMLLYFIEDYAENGPYSNRKNIIETNGDGEILWDKTINETFAIIQNGRPIYTELYTGRTENDDSNYFKRLHEAVVNESFRQLEETGIAELFGISSFDLTEETIDDFGDKDYILGRIEKELSVQFNTRKQTVLKALYSFINEKSSLLADNSYSLFGSNSFNLVWERVCAKVFGNDLDKPLSSLETEPKIDSKETLRSVISKPDWYVFGKKFSTETLKPDFIVIRKKEEKICFIVFDAKYYNIRIEGDKLKGYPGIEATSKQFLYELAYTEFTKEHNIGYIANCFVMPSEKDGCSNEGFVKFELFGDIVNLHPIQLLFVNARDIYESYLADRELSFTQTGIILDEVSSKKPSVIYDLFKEKFPEQYKAAESNVAKDYAGTI